MTKALPQRPPPQPPSWFKFIPVPQGTDFSKSAIDATLIYPGVKLERDGQTIRAPLNAAWLVEAGLRAAGQQYKVHTAYVVQKKWPGSLGDIKELRRVDPKTGMAMGDFVNAYQLRETFRTMSTPGVIFRHPTGCVSGDAEVIINRGGAAKRITLQELVFKFNGGAASTNGHRWDLNIPTFTQCKTTDGCIHLNQIVAAVASGMKETFDVRAGAFSLRATADHKFLTLDHTGAQTWVPISELRPGMAVLVNSGQATEHTEKAPKRYYPQVAGMRHHPFAGYVTRRRSDLTGAQGGKGCEEVYRVPMHRLVAEAVLNDLDDNEYIHRVKTGEVAGLAFLDPSVFHVHHKDENTLNFTRGNLEVLPGREHWRKHAEQGGYRHVLYKLDYQYIDSITSFGVEETFDLTMAEPYNNFVANGIVVHNSGKSLEAMIWTLAQPGQIVIVTGAKGRVQWKNQIERYTTATTHVITGTGNIEEHEFEVGSFYEHKDVGTAMDLWKGINLDPRSVSQCSCGFPHTVEVVRRKIDDSWTFIARVAFGIGAHSMPWMPTSVIVRPQMIPRDARFIVIGWEILAYHADALCALKPAAVVLDECFPPDTSVETETGPRRIADTVPGDRVWSWDCERREAVLATVTFTWRRPVTSHRFVKVTHEHGSFVCTENHNIWVEGEGYYVNAGALSIRDHLRVLRSAAQAAPRRESQAEVLQQGLLGEVAGVHSTRQGYQLSGREGVGGDRRRIEINVAAAQLPKDRYYSNEAAQPDEGRRQQSEVVGHAQSNEAQATQEERERLGNDGLGAADPQRAADAELEPRNRDTSVGARQVRLPSSQLQGGLRLDTVQAGNRDRRDVAQGSGQTRARPPKGEDFVLSRVVNVEILERNSVEEPKGGCGRDFVYDLEVDGTHDYFAAGVLVSNSHRGQQHRQWKIVPVSEADLDHEPKAKQLDDGRWIKYVSLENIAASADKLCKVAPRRLLLTATLVKDRIRAAWAQLNFLAPWDFGTYWVFARRYCGATTTVWGGMDDKGCTHLEELTKRLAFHDSYVTREEANANLPDVRREVIYLPPEAQQLEDPGFARELMSAAPATITSIKLAAACSRKRKALCEAIVEAANSGAKVCVFTARHNDVDVLSAVLGKQLSKNVKLFATDGRTPVDKRAAQVAEYMALRSHAVMVAVGYALGEQIDLNETDLFMLAMLPVTPGELVQWEGRVLRQGSTRKVLIQYWVAEGTVDERIVSILLDKLPAVEQIGTEGVVGIARSLKGDEDALLAELAASILAGSRVEEETRQ